MNEFKGEIHIWMSLGPNNTLEIRIREILSEGARTIVRIIESFELQKFK